MAEQTTNLHLKKPEYSESADVAVFNENMEIIDAAINNTLEVTDSGKVLDARQGKVLNDGKIDKTSIVNSLEETGEGKVLDARQGKTLNDGKVDKTSIVNTLTETGEGKVLDARQGKILNEGKIDNPSSVPQGKFLQTNENGEAVWGDPFSGTDVAAAVDVWMDEHTGAGSFTLDDTLTGATSAAQAKAAGDGIKAALANEAPVFNASSTYKAGQYVTYGGVLYRLTADHAADVTWASTSKVECNLGGEVTDLKSAMTKIDDKIVIAFIPGYNVPLGSYSIGDTVTITTEANPGWQYAVIDCEDYDRFYGKFQGGNNPRAYAFLDADNKLLLMASASQTLTNLIPPRGAKKVIINDSSKMYPFVYKTNLKDGYEELYHQSAASGCEQIIFNYKQSINIATSTQPGTEVTISPSDATDYESIVVNCCFGDIMFIDVLGGGSPKAWAFLDKDNKLISKSGENANVSQIMQVPQNAAKCVLNNKFYNGVDGKSKPNYIFRCNADNYSIPALVEIKAVGGKTDAKPFITGTDQYYFHANEKKLKRVITYSGSDFTDETIPTNPNKVYQYQNTLCRIIDGSIKPILDDSIIVIQGIGLKMFGNTGVSNVGQYYVHKTERKLKRITSFTSPTNFTDETLNFYAGHVYYYNGIFYGSSQSVSTTFDQLNELKNVSYKNNVNNEISTPPDFEIGAYIRGIKFADELKDHLIDFKKTGDLMVHVSTFCIINGIVYCSYYVNTRTSQEDPTKHTARLAYCPLNDPSDMTFIDVQDVGDTFDGMTVDELYDTILMRKDDETLYVMWTAKLNGEYYRLYRTFDVLTGNLGSIAYNYFYVGSSGDKWNTTNMNTYLSAAGIKYRQISGDIGIMQKISTRVEDGTTYYYSGAYAGAFNCIIKSSDLINWKFVACPEIALDTQWENAVYVVGNFAYYFVRMYPKYSCGILMKYDLNNLEWSEPVYVNDAQSRSDFIYWNNNLWLVHAPHDRNHIAIMSVAQGYLNQSFDYQVAKVPDYFYPYMDIYENKLYMSFTASRQHIYLSEFTIDQTILTDDNIIAKFAELFEIS